MLNLKSTNIVSSSLYIDNKFKQCLKKQLWNMFKLWCDWGIHQFLTYWDWKIQSCKNTNNNIVKSKWFMSKEQRAENLPVGMLIEKKIKNHRTPIQWRTVSSDILVLNCPALSPQGSNLSLEQWAGITLVYTLLTMKTRWDFRIVSLRRRLPV